jgi:predicted HTH transcriptional regulator
MKTVRIFISSVQKEFAAERTVLREYIRSDPLLSKFFETFLFEYLPDGDRRVDDAYIGELEKCAIYIGIFGDESGHENRIGVSPTEQEFTLAGKLRIPRFIYVKGADDLHKHKKMQALIRKAGNELIRRRFSDPTTLLPALYASLVFYLEERKLIRNCPFDAAPCQNAAVSDLNRSALKVFIREARASRGFPLKETATTRELLTHLNLLDSNQVTHAAILLFGKEPQKFLPSSEVKCAHFHGVEVAKPIPSYQVYRGTAFVLVESAVDFVMSKLALSVGTRSQTTQAPVEYEIPREVVVEGIVNAIAHRDYSSNGSVQVMLFADRLEIWNPGTLPSALTIELLRLPHGSVPHNPLLAEPLYLTKYIERMGTGTRDMIQRCKAAGLSEPLFNLADGFSLIIHRPKKNGRLGDGLGDGLGDSAQNRIVNIIMTDRTISISAMSRRLNISTTAIEKTIRRMKIKGVLTRIGPVKGGYWKISKQKGKSH